MTTVDTDHPALAALVPRLWPAQLTGGLPLPEPATGLSRDPARRLAALLDFRSGVRLAELLKQEPESDALAPAALREKLAASLDELSQGVGRHFDDASLRWLCPPDVLEVVLLADGAGPAGLSDERIQRLAAMFTGHLSQCLLWLQRQLDPLQRQLWRELREAGGRAATLQRLDEVLIQGSREASEALLARLVPAYSSCFARTLRRALPGSLWPDRAQLELAYDPGGWLHGHFALGRDVSFAVLEAQSGLLVSLVDAACALEDGKDLQTPDRPEDDPSAPAPRVTS